MTVELKEHRDLTPKQRIFVLEYIKTLNASGAAVTAGYSAKTAPFIGYENLKKPYIAAAIQRQQRALQESILIGVEAVVLELARLSFYDVKDLYDKETNTLLPINEIPTDMRRAIIGIKHTTKTYTDQDGGVEVTSNVDYRLADKGANLDRLGRTLGIFTADNKQKQGPAPITFNMEPTK